MIDIRRPKVKHLIGSFRDSPLYPEADDLEYVVQKWFHLDGGKEFVHVERRLEETGLPIIDDKALIELLGQEAFDRSIDGFMTEGRLGLHKETSFTRYFKLTKSETYAMIT